MTMLTWLDDALRAGGLRVIENDGWRSRGHGQMTGRHQGIEGVLCHHTAGGGSNDWKVVQNGRPGLSGPLAQLVLERDGTFRCVAAGQAWHAGNGTHPAIGTNNGNSRLVGIEGVSRGVGDDWTAAQRDAYVRGVAAICRYAGLGSDRVIFHREWARPSGRKSDPQGFDGATFRRQVQAVLNGGKSASTPAPPAPATAPTVKKGLPLMIERALPSGNSTGRIVCPTGSASGIVSQAWVSVSFDGSARVELWAQRHAAGSDVPAGAGDKAKAERDWTLHRGERAWFELPSGTEYLSYRITGAAGPGSLLVEQKAK